MLIFFGGEVSRLTRRGIRDKNGTPALLSWRQNTVPRCCRRGLTPATAPCFTPVRWSPTTCRCPADAADVSPAQQQPAGAYRPADPRRTGSMRSPALASLPAAAISTLNSCAKGCRGGLKPKAPSPVRKTGRCSNANCTRPNAWPHRRWQSDLPLAAQRPRMRQLRELGRSGKSPSARSGKAAAKGGYRRV